MHKRHQAIRAASLFWSVAILLAGGNIPAAAQEDPTPPVEAEAEADASSDIVTITIQDGSLVQVLNAFSRQTGKSIVIGPEVEAVVNVRLSDIPWQEALDVILKPYGFGYQLVGEAIVVGKLENFQTVQRQEPLVSRVFQLKYLDAAGVQDVLDTQLSERGKWSALTVRGQRGWASDNRARQRTGAGDSGMGRREREMEDPREIESQRLRSKTIIVVDTADVVEKIAAMLSEVDRMPIQVLIEARFVEVTSDALRDIGVEFGTGPNATSVPGVQAVPMESGGHVVGLGVRQTGANVTPAAFNPVTRDLGGTRPQQAGLSLLFQQITDIQFEVLLHMLEEDARANLLSSPRVLTLNDQEATILVGTKYPIIESDSSTGQASGTVTTSLQYYEDIGIQLNVVPQICEGDYIRMVVNPKVRQLLSTTSGVTGVGSNVALTPYPILSTREAETQIMARSGQTIVIGGLLEDQETRTELSVPFLSSLPLVGRLFRRETVNKKKMDLLIFLTATVIQPVGSSADAAELVAVAASDETSAEATARLATAEARRAELAAREAERERLAAERAILTTAENGPRTDSESVEASVDAARQIPVGDARREAVLEQFPPVTTPRP